MAILPAIRPAWKASRMCKAPYHSAVPARAQPGPLRYRDWHGVPPMLLSGVFLVHKGSGHGVTRRPGHAAGPRKTVVVSGGANAYEESSRRVVLYCCRPTEGPGGIVLWQGLATLPPRQHRLVPTAGQETCGNPPGGHSARAHRPYRGPVPDPEALVGLEVREGQGSLGEADVR